MNISLSDKDYNEAKELSLKLKENKYQERALEEYYNKYGENAKLFKTVREDGVRKLVPLSTQEQRDMFLAGMDAASKEKEEDYEKLAKIMIKYFIQ